MYVNTSKPPLGVLTSISSIDFPRFNDYFTSIETFQIYKEFKVDNFVEYLKTKRNLADVMYRIQDTEYRTLDSEYKI